MDTNLIRQNSSTGLENNIALYRKYRPKDFEQIIGQEHIVQTLKNSIKNGAISHAYLFSGPRGSGKTTMARIFAKAINCFTTSKLSANASEKSIDKIPCNECDSCLEINTANSMDLIEIDAASHTGVNDVRELIDGIKFAPVKSKYKIFIIDECHQLSKAASNALLKTLEEPPAHAIFLLATTEAHKMLPTIISRCQRFDFKRLITDQIVHKLEFIAKQEDVVFEPQALSLIALNARGSFRDAESLLDKCMSFSGKKNTITAKEVKELLGIVEVLQVSRFVDLILAKQAKEAIVFLNNLADEGVDLQEFTKTLIFYIRQALLLKINPELLQAQTSGLSKEELVIMNTQIEKLTVINLQLWLKTFINAENTIKYAIITQLPLELAIIDLTQAN